MRTEAEAGAEAVFGTLADAGLDFIQVTEFEAWRPAFGNEGESLVRRDRALDVSRMEGWQDFRRHVTACL
ncbi:hypothetical protein [Cupriavidus necator]